MTDWRTLPPTGRQIRTLGRLSAQVGRPYLQPADREHASNQIDALLRLTRRPRRRR